MFTGIVEAIGRIERSGKGELVVSRPPSFTDLALGASISVAGVCLTATAFDEAIMKFAVVPETLAKTTLGNKAAGDVVNLERALRADGRFDGHIVQGHIEATGNVLPYTRSGEDVRLTVAVPDALSAFVIPKGSIAIDGVSLTVADCSPGQCTVALVPHTLSHTTLGALEVGNTVNLETDMLVRAVQWIVAPHAH